ncbi:hypothetical protein PVT67_07380 [Gallaecimonas kandeliae]|uniref:CLCA_X family protein n=1 Tax=Gallaecimonas kandeliae TaxID=3029055 RepID=UPI002648A603|nr:CLCA_X family protein [Gallaecimonas kandeliae]WKE67052.1 hypothetical protein PVT67_07380 [Gallaecimonas kandeliae]
MSTPSRLHRDYWRRGPDYRFGEDRTFAEVRDQFGLAGVRVGAWVSAEEQQLAANLVFDALADLAWVLKVPPWTLGLRGQLQLAFGTRGSPGAQAHYEPATRILALAKNAGGGALAHEFWHAFDHHVAAHLYPGCPPRALASHLWLKRPSLRAHPLNLALAEVFKQALLSEDGQAPSDYVRRAIALDKQLGRPYYSQPTELLARAFESFVQDDREIANPYLVTGTHKSAAAKEGAYPQGQHRRALGQAFGRYFALLGQALARQEQP